MTGRILGSHLMAASASLLLCLALPALAAPQYDQQPPPNQEIPKPSKKDRKKQKEEEVQAGPQLSKEFRGLASKAQGFATDKKWTELLAALPEMEALPNLNRDEKKFLATWRLQATQGMGDQDGFAAAIEVFLNEGYAEPSQLGPMHRQLAAHYNNKQDRAKTVEHFRKFVDVAPEVQPDELETLGRLYRQNSNFAECSTWFGKAMDLVASKGATPKEEWYQLRDHCIGELKDNPARLANLEALVAHYPEKKYYSNIIALYQLESKEDRIVMLNAYRLAVSDPRGGLATVGGYLSYADLALVAGSPGEAARALERGMKDGVVPSVGTNQQTLKDAKAAVLADQKTLATEAASAGKSAKGEVAVKVGLGFFSAGNYEKAAAMVRQGIAKGGVARLDDANLLLGASLMAMGPERREEARAAFEAAASAAGGNNAMARIARMWMALAARNEVTPAAG